MAGPSLKIAGAAFAITVDAERRILRDATIVVDGQRITHVGKADALKDVPAINAQIDGDHLVQNNYYDVGVAVSMEKGLMVPVIRNCDTLGMAQIEKAIGDAAKRARDGKITLADLEGGVFTITNGGIFGSMLSTPIINPPQSAILGLHAINDRPVALNGQVVIRPMMYLALSYDHRIVDGKEAVTFLVKVKQAIEDPARLLLSI